MKSKSEKGFTIFELLGVLVIFSFVSYFLFSAILSLKDNQYYELQKVEVNNFQALFMKEIMDDLTEYNPALVRRGKSNWDNDYFDIFSFESPFSENAKFDLRVDVDNDTISYRGITYPVPEECDITSVDSGFVTRLGASIGEPIFMSIKITMVHNDLEGNFGFDIIYQVSDPLNFSFVYSYFDTDYPTITLYGEHDYMLALGTSFTDPGAYAYDDTDGTLTGSISTSGTVDHNTEGTYVITYSVANSLTNTSVIKRNVIVYTP